MLIRTAIALTVVLAACVTTVEPVAEHDQAIVCGTLCDPGHATFDDALYGAYDYAHALYADALKLDQSCADIGSVGAPGWECIVNFTMDESPCLLLTVECNDLSGRVRCNHHESNCQF